ncbi:Tat pathway signal sequence domain protein [Streptomyces sp. S.PNR 29]|uniref:Tat pathway signal sequence domain protein n=1 Tax=Streptomyces sp. S.PNR 29 TaxID=2973805 RepID=UPI0025AFED98|nr:Tat pathway signal sequence domain protein [Streptomyces sp. S.PNR 29]MDN0197280.1 Tat pathway signal sequence domain protein [Streptomyces sp. S.PNR 29]
MRKTVHRHLGKVVAGAAIAVAGTAVMIGVTLPGTAGADDTGTRGANQAARQTAEGQDQNTVAPGVVEQAPAEGDKGAGRDPLTDDEIERVERLAVDRQQFNAGENVEGDRGPQQLSVDLAEPEADEVDDPNAPRRAEVTFYDYKSDALVTKTINLDTGKVEDTTTRHGVQPPASRAENIEAARLLIADPLGADLKADYKDATGKELTSPDQLLLTSGVYRAAPGAQPAALDRCGEHRCLRLFPKVRNGPWIDARHLVIDLSARKVAELDRG